MFEKIRNTISKTSKLNKEICIFLEFEKKRNVSFPLPDEIKIDTVVKYKKKSRTVKEWAKEIKISVECFKFRLKKWGICDRTFLPKEETCRQREDQKRIKTMVRKMRGDGVPYKKIIEAAKEKGIKNMNGKDFTVPTLAKIHNGLMNNK